MGAYDLHPLDARAIFLHNDLLCMDRALWGVHNVLDGGGGANGNDPFNSRQLNSHTFKLQGTLKSET